MKKLWKHIVGTALLSVLLVPAVSVEAKVEWLTVGGIEGGQVQFDTDSGYIVGAKTTITQAIIPETITGVTVVGIDNDAFSQCKEMVTVYIPDTVVVIEDGTSSKGAFSGCSTLTSIRLPQGLTAIPTGMFLNCTALTSESFAIPDSVTSVGEYAFKGCTSIRRVNLPDSVDYIGQAAFYGCSMLGTFVIPDGVEKIEKSTFSECTILATVYVPLSLKEIETNAFKNTSGMQTVYFQGDNSQKASMKIGTVNEYFSNVPHEFLAQPEDVVTQKYSFWAETFVKSAYANDLLTSSLGTNFSTSITRGQIAEILVNLVERATNDILLPAPSYTFGDTSNLSVLKAYQAQIVGGTSTDKFSSGNNATRQEIAVMANAAIKVIQESSNRQLISVSTTLPSSYTDSSEVQFWANDAMATLIHNGIMAGISDTELSPEGNTTIEQAIVLVLNIYKLL